MIKKIVGVSLILTVIVVSWLTYYWWFAKYQLLAELLPERNLALTPPMGWNGWNHFRCSPDLNEKTVKEMIDALVNSGMRDAGYQYVVLDDCWQAARSNNGSIIADPFRFPGGIKALADYAHQRGLKFGIYTSAGKTTCEGRPGSYGFERHDAALYAKWGVDYVKVDWCGIEYLQPAIQYRIWREAINATGRPMVLSIAIANIDKIPDHEAWIWGRSIAEMWRTAIDVVDWWPDFLRVFDRNTEYSLYQTPGAWNDADMMHVGNKNGSVQEYRTHFTLWAVMGSPLIAGNDVRKMTPEIRDILTNREIIAVNQDPLGKGAFLVKEGVGWQVWVKQLTGRGERAVVLLNRSNLPQKISFTPTDLGIMNWYVARDIWAKKDLGWQQGEFEQLVLPRQAIMLKVQGFDQWNWQGLKALQIQCHENEIQSHL